MKWDSYTSACDICGYRLEGYDEQNTLCGACLNDIENEVKKIRGDNAMSRDTAYYPNKLWVDVTTGVFGDPKSIVTLNLDSWSNEDVYTWETMTDSERQDYARVVMEANEQTATPLEYMKQEAEYK